MKLTNSSAKAGPVSEASAVGLACVSCLALAHFESQAYLSRINQRYLKPMLRPFEKLIHLLGSLLQRYCEYNADKTSVNKLTPFNAGNFSRLLMHIERLISLFRICSHRRQCWLLMAIIAAPLPVLAATEEASIVVQVVRVITMTNSSGLVFGDISASGVAGTVVLTPAGSREVTGGASINSTVASGPAVFDIVAEPNSTYAITLPGVVVLNNTGGGNMVVDNFASFPGSIGLTDGGGEQDLFVGATLNVGSNQAFGSYTGTMSVTIGYN